MGEGISFDGGGGGVEKIIRWGGGGGVKKNRGGGGGCPHAPPSMGNPVLGPLFLIYINDLHTAIQYGKVHHFTDDKNLFHL